MNTSKIVVTRGDDVYEAEFVLFRTPLYTRKMVSHEYNEARDEWVVEYVVGDEVTGRWITYKNGVRFDAETDKDAFIVHYIGKGKYDDL